MKLPVYCYRDAKVGFMNPMLDQNDDSAIRGFAYAVNSQNGIMGFQPADFDLFRLGIFDTDTGGYVLEPIPVLVVSGLSVAGAK